MLLGTLLAAVAAGVLLYRGQAFLAWVGGGGLLLAFAWMTGGASAGLFLVTLLFVALAVLFGRLDLRRAWVSSRVMPLVGRMLPRLGDTERIALEAGTVWWDGEIFSGRPNWERLLAFEKRGLSPKESAFLEGPVEELCRMLDDWEIAQHGDLPPEVWKFLATHRFFGMIIPEEFGGLAFSAAAHSAVVVKLATRSVTAAVTVMVPNSLGPSELLLHYGTDEQKSRLLPRLASGEEIPCFALTGPEAGSDAAATQSNGVVCRGTFEGRETLGMKLNWRKRYITLGPVSTLIGLAFQLRDPDHLLGPDADLGITCALVPSNLPGIDIGSRHDPMGIPFQNGPNTGTDVFLPLEFIIGGREGAGRGWRMLMESLAAGRAISLPSLSVGASKLCARVVSAYSMVREQFDTPIGRFEGVEEPLARIAGLTYMMDATRALTVAAVDAGEKPAVLSAIAKAYLTEAMRSVVNDAMDIRAGAAIMRGPRNILARAYAAVPIGITVEGANILTRSMIIYGQGAIRCHPFVQAEIEAVGSNDLQAFDRAFFGHLGFIASMAVRSLALGITGGRITQVSGLRAGWARSIAGRVDRLCAAFALVSDAAMGTLGGSLKRREKITGRLADTFAWLYLASATLKRFHDEGELDADAPLARWGCEWALLRAETALAGTLRNLPNRAAAWGLHAVVFPLGRRERGPSDRRGAEVAAALLDDPEVRERLTGGTFIPPEDEPGLGRLEWALKKARPALAVEARIRQAVRDGRIERQPGEELAQAARAAGIIRDADLETLHEADAARDEVIRVDAFSRDEALRP